MTKSKALFLDEMELLILTMHMFTKKMILFLDGIFELTTKAKAKNYLVIIVTNQAGIGRGYYSEEDF